MKKGVLIFWIVIAVVVVGGLAFSLLPAHTGPGQYDKLAQCIKENDVKFYGAFWCPHCQRTKQEFGSSAALLPYVECSTPDGQGQTQVCKDKGIQVYPTWLRPDGASITGEHPVEEIASFSGCTVDGQKTAFSTVATSTAPQSSSVAQ